MKSSKPSFQMLVMLFWLLLPPILILNPFVALSQTYTTVSKSCGSCGGTVSSSAKIGDYCPHCGVRWGYENTTKKNTTVYQKSKSSTLPNYRQPNNSYPSTRANQNTNENSTVERNPFASYSKSSLEGWILSKLNQYKQPFTHHFSDKILNKGYSTKYEDFNFSIKEGYLIVSFYEEGDGNITVFVPIKDIQYLYSKSYEDYFAISTSGDKMYEVNNNTNVKKTIGYIKVGLKINSEVDLVKNIENALKQLGKFYPSVDYYNLPSNNTTPSNKPSIEETKSWIIQKLNQNSKTKINCSGSSPGFNSSCPHEAEFTFSFYDDGWLKINYVDKQYQRTAMEVYIPICECTYAKNNSSMNNEWNTFIFYSRFKKIKSSKGELSEFALNIDYSKEDDLGSRLVKAFMNLKSYCQSSPNNKETF